MAYRILVKPLVTEKAANLGSLNQYAFVVSDSANKIDVAKAIFEVYGVKPEKVNIIKVKGKVVSRGKITGKRKDFKKALVSLKKGDSISIYEGV
ncbi:MAG: 50S ribosomal protein L23 [Patescibacteria group bacterium]|nr:50S ribosomal protein L23 [Patescibacteria group bacterium]